MSLTSPRLLSSEFWTRPRLVTAVVLASFLLRLWAAWQLPEDFDEPVYLKTGYDYAQMIKNGDWNGITNYPENQEHPPLVKLLYAAVILFAGPDATYQGVLFISRLVSAVFGTLAVLALALFDPLAGAFLAVQTLTVKYTSQAYLEALPLFATLVAVFALHHSRVARDRWFWLSAGALGLTAAGKYSYFPILFVILFIFWEKSRLHLPTTGVVPSSSNEPRSYPWWDILLYLGVAAITFLVLDPALWRDPVTRLVNSITFHAQYAQGAHVQTVGYPWYQPFVWVARSNAYIWHPDVFFYFGFDGLIFLFALAGVVFAWRKHRWVVIWLGTGMLSLLLYPTKWPQYALVVLPALCLSAAPALRFAYRWLKEQNSYWDWLGTMLPRPSRAFIIVLIAIFAILTLGWIANMSYISLNRLGWSTIRAGVMPLPSDTVNDMAKISDGRIAIATDGGAAVWTAAVDKELLDHWDVFTTENSGLPDNRILAVVVDHTGALWFGTRAGLGCYDGHSWTTYHADDFQLSGEQVQALAEGNDGNLWVGTSAGAAMFDGKTWTPYTSLNSGLLGDTVFSLAVQPHTDGDWVWFGTLAGVSRLDTANSEWVKFPSAEFGVGWGGIVDLMIDSTGRLWAATQGGGIGLWDGQAWSYYRVSNSELPYNTVNEVVEFDGVYWIATAIPGNVGGVVTRFDGEKWHTYTPNLSGYSGAETLAIVQDPLGRIWFGTRTKGIDLYQP